jgi:hypothetical protein
MDWCELWRTVATNTSFLLCHSTDRFTAFDALKIDVHTPIVALQATDYTVHSKNKGKVVPVLTTKAQGGKRGVHVLTLSFGITET